MKFLKLFFKIAVALLSLFIIFIIILLSGESYETITMNTGDETVVVEIKKLFGRKLTECSINSDGFYDGPSKSWDLLSNQIRSEGLFKNGYWHGKWKEYDRYGQLIMIREWNKGVLVKVFVPIGDSFKEVPKKEWPKHVNVRQHKAQKINGKKAL
jgi:antitoxin component YwqK of YwqJK toxin-antitoxin module